MVLFVKSEQIRVEIFGINNPGIIPGALFLFISHFLPAHGQAPQDFRSMLKKT